MSEPAQAAPLLPQQSLAPSAGAMLRAAREAAGLHIAALAVSLKIPVRKLEALETDRLDLLPDAVFARALASSVCRSLKVDPDPVLRLLPQVDLQQLSAYERGINAPFSSSGDMARASLMEQLSRPVVLTALALCVAALVLVLFPLKEPRPAAAPESLPPAAAAAEAAPAQAAPPLVPVPAAEIPQVAPPLEAGSAATAAPAPMPGQAVSEARMAAAPPVAQVAQVAASASRLGVASEPVTAAGAGIMVLNARADSWVEVTDAARVVQLSRVLRAGESVGVGGALPLSVAVGRADVTAVLVRGKALDLAPWTRDNVARFEVK